MPKFAANVSMLYPEHAFLDRFDAAAADGFRAVECLFPYAWPVGEIAARLKSNHLKLILLNASPGDWDGGERGLASLPGYEAKFWASVTQALAYAVALECPKVHILSGLRIARLPRWRQQQIYVRRLRWAAAQAGKVGIGLLIEPINLRDMPGYFLNHQAHAQEIMDEVGAENLELQLDIYHCQIVEGDVACKLRHYLSRKRVGHIQIAGVPDRNEPDSGELNYPYLFDLVDRLGYTGWIGCEYRPRTGSIVGGTSTGLDWLRSYAPARAKQGFDDRIS